MRRMLGMLLMLALLLSCTPLPQTVQAATQEVTLSSGSSLDSAIAEVTDGGTIQVSGTVEVSSLSTHGKSVTVTGGELSFTSTSVTLLDSITFRNITLTFPSGATLYAGGNKVTIGEGVTLTNPITVYGGKNGGTVASTDLTLLSGTYTNVYGGSNGGTVTGDTRLTVGGTVNADIDETDHSGENRIHGGSYAGSIGGTAYTVFTGSAKARYLYGGNRGSGTISGGTHVTVSGGSLMSVNGGGRSGDHKGNATLTITGGTMEQVFGGAIGSGMTGDVSLNVLGGTITRRIYGGCYNEVTRSGLSFVWSSSYYVTGNVTLTIGGGAAITFTYDDSDKSIYAHSRQKTLSSTENAQIFFADATAYRSYKGKLKAQDITMLLIMGSTSAADAIHYHTYTASGAVITQACAYETACATTATLSLSGGTYTYTGSPIEPASVTCSTPWTGGTPQITYTDNVNAGTATAAITRDGTTASVSFTIANAPQEMPAVSGTDETVLGKADGRINGLTTAMEYSADGTAFAPVSDPEMTFEPGTWYVRYAAKTNYDASPATAVAIGSGRMLKVTFQAEGQEDVVREVAWNGTLTDIPAVPVREGYTQTAPRWDVTDFTGIQADMTVTAVYTVNNYTVTYVADGETVSMQTVEHGADAAAPTIPRKEGHDQTAPYWDKDGTNITADTVINAVYTVNTYTVTYVADGSTVSSQTVEHGKDAAAPTIPHKEGHDQTAPYWDKDGTNITADTVINAVYTINTYTVIFQYEDGTVISAATYRHGDAVTVPAKPEAPGGAYVFVGWGKDVTLCTGDAVYTAVFEPVSITWTLDAAGTLTISGTGEIPDYGGENTAPWYSQRSAIKKVVLETGVTGIGSNAFADCPNLVSVTIPADVTGVGENAFSGCAALKQLYYEGTGEQLAQLEIADGNDTLAKAQQNVDCSMGLTAVPKASTGKPMLSWNAVEGATKYEIYRATSVTGKYKKIKTVTTLSYTDTSAAIGTEYYYRVRAVSKTGSLPEQGFTSLRCVCAQPKVTVKVSTTTGLPSLSWKKVSGASRYQIWRAETADGEYALLATQKGLSFTDKTAEGDAVYYYKVNVVATKTGANSVDAAPLEVRTVCAKPVIKAGTVEYGKPQITWQTISGAVQYSILRATSSKGKYTEIGTTAELSYVDETAVVGKLYYYKVQAVGASSTSAISAYKSIRCCADRPVITVTRNDASGKPVITWEAVEGAKKYEVWRATKENGKYTRRTTTTALTYTDTGATPGYTYYYKVYTVPASTAAKSKASNIGSMFAICAQPNVKISYSTTGQHTLSWKKVTGASKYEILRAETAEGPYTLMTTQKGTSYTDKATTPDALYYYKVNVISSKAGANSVEMTPLAVARAVARPTISKLTNDAASGKPVLTWKAIDGAVSYKIYRATSSKGTYTEIGNTAELSFVDETAAVNKTYYYKVSACGTVSQSTQTAYKSIRCKCAAPSASASVTAGDPVISWEAVEGAKKYEVYRATSENGKYTKVKTTTALSWTDTSAKAGKTYYYKVKAVAASSSANSAYSSILSAAPN